MHTFPLEQRLLALEARMRALEALVAPRGDEASPACATVAPSHPPAVAGTEPPAPPASGEEGALWALGGLLRRLGAGQGGVVYAGRYSHPAGGEVQWQMGRPQQVLLDEDWSELAPRLAALGHPVRLRLAQLLLQGMGAVADLAAQPGMGTSGQLYHHLRELEATGWLHSPQRGVYALRPERIVALMAMLTAARQ
jgi:DNA-binding transcriptional ArsR family regulator